MSGDWWDDLADGLRFWMRVGVIAVILVPILLSVIVVLVVIQ